MEIVEVEWCQLWVAMDTVVNEKQNKLSTYQHQDIGDKALGLRVLGWASILRMLSLEELKDPTLFGFGLTLSHHAEECCFTSGVQVISQALWAILNCRCKFTEALRRPFEIKMV